MYLNEILPGNWREDEWPEHIEVSHESSRFKSRRYVPRVNSANKSSANPVDGIRWTTTSSRASSGTR